MTGFEMLWPMVVHAGLVFVLYILLAYRRFAFVKKDPQKAAALAMKGRESPHSLIVNQSIANQFEIPVLFHVVSVVIFLIQADNLPAVLLAWLFVALRIVHAYVHIALNNLRLRLAVFLLGVAVLAALWAWLAVWMLFS